jgi:hypothetical protein
MNILVTMKNEYLIRIKNLLTKLIFGGLNSIYDKTREVSNDEDVLKMYQSLLKRVPKWTDDILSNEVLRIKSVLDIENKYDLVNDMIKASIKTQYNIMVFGSNNTNNILDILAEFNFKDFIKNVYIEASRELYNNPFLFYHNYSPIEIKRNQREVLEIIGKSIEETLRGLLPIKLILNSYLNNSSLIGVNDSEEDIVEKMVKDDLEKDIYNNPVPLSLEIPVPLSLEIPLPEPIIEPSNNTKFNFKPIDSIIPKDIQVGGYENNSVENKILDIINEKSLNLTNQISDFEKNSNSCNETFMVKNATEQSINNIKIESKYPVDYSSKKVSKTHTDLDSKLEKILKNDLGDSDTDSTMIDNNQYNYQEVFSNSNTSHDSSLNSQQKNDELNKNKFFANYLNI